MLTLLLSEGKVWLFQTVNVGWELGVLLFPTSSCYHPNLAILLALATPILMPIHSCQCPLPPPLPLPLVLLLAAALPVIAYCLLVYEASSTAPSASKTDLLISCP